jgi:hypothetical protein
MDQSLYSMKFSELRTYAKSLGLSELPAKKEPLLELIKSHFEAEQAAAAAAVVQEKKAAKPKRKVGRAPKAEPKPAENQAEPAEVAGETKEQDEEKQPKKVKKLKKEKSKTKLDEEPAQEKTAKAKKAKKPAQTEETAEPKEKRTKKRAKKQDEAAVVVQEPEQTAPVETNKKKKTKKRPSEANEPGDEDPSPAKKAKVAKKPKKVAKSSKSKTKLAEPEIAEAKSTDEKSLGDEFELRMDEESVVEQVEPAQLSANNNTSQRHSARLATPKQNATLNAAAANPNPHSSIMTNDEEEARRDETVELDNDPNITKDIANETFDKSPELELNKEEESAPSGGANVMPCSSFYSQKTPAKEAKQEVGNEATDEKPKAKAGGARIVRPKQTVVEVVKAEASKSEEEVVVVVVKKVDVVQREAGPRIVKPTGVEENSKKGDEPVAAKKNKSEAKSMKIFLS